MKRSALLLSSLALSACGSDGTGAIDSFIQDVATEQCSWQFRCCTDGEIKAQDGHKFADQTGCVPYRQLALQDQLFMSRLAARQGRLKLDDKKSQACLDMMKAQTCNPKPGQPAAMPSLNMNACANVFAGSTPIGGQCQFPFECIDGARCVFNKLTPGSGVCEPFQKTDEICNLTEDCDPLVPQLYCSKNDYKCHLRSKLGDKCAYTMDTGKAALPLLIECDNTIGNAYCDPVSSTCKQLPAANEPCLAPPPPGVSSSCDPDPRLHLVCRTTAGSTTGVCMGPARNGEDCTNVQCDSGLYCDSSTGTSRTCKPLPALGQSCNTSGVCAAPYFCNFNKAPAICDQPAQLGQPCGAGTVCDVTLYCDTTAAASVCKAKLADGTMCTISTQCLSNDCSATSPRVCNPTPPSAVLCFGRN